MKKYTTYDIAKKLNLSRTTVSKALNSHPEIPDKTRQKVLNAAVELGYKIKPETINTHPVEQSDQTNENDKKNIAFLIKRSINIFQNGYWGDILFGVEELSRQHGYQLVITFLTDDDLDNDRLPEHITPANTEGIILAGITTKHFANSLSKLDIPFVSIDGYHDISINDMKSDSVLMESEQSVYDLTTHLIQLGHRAIGFIGDVYNCRSFMERWTGYRRALMDAGIAINLDFCITQPSPTNYFHLEELVPHLERISELPTAFVCANDLVALLTIEHLNNNNIRVPQDISITGFDLMRIAPDSSPVRSKLTTVEVRAVQIGIKSFEQLLLRIQEPERPYEFIRITSRVILGDTTAAPKN